MKPARRTCLPSIARRALAVLAAVAAATWGAGCEIERLFPEEVGAGAARLTVSNAGNLLSIINDDATCGFESPLVKSGFVTNGAVGGSGSVTFNVVDCVIDFGSIPQVVGTACDGTETKAAGKVTISATRTIEGLLTGNVDTPVIPQQPDAVHLTLSAQVQNYEITSSTSDKSVIMHSGAVDVAATVHLATSASLGVCSVPTGDVTLDSVKVHDAAYTIKDGPDHIFGVDVPRAEVTAQVGKFGDKENFIDGTITVWDKEVSLAADHALDPGYDAQKFADGYACTEDLKLPVEHTCGSIKDKLAQGAAQLSIADVGNITSVFSKDTTCGLASPQAKANATFEGEVGRDGGTEVIRVDEPCVIDFGAEGRAGREDCNGDAPTIFGRVSFTGSLTIHGRLTGNPDQPIIPGARDAVDIETHLEMENARVQGANPESLEIVHGSVSAVMHPRMAIDTSIGACAIDTPVTSFDHVQWAPGTQALVHAAQGTFAVGIDGSDLHAQNGDKDGVEENLLIGSITLDGDTFDVPVGGGAPTLDPTYARDAFVSSFICEQNLRVPESDAECNMHQVIGDGVARLIVQTVGTVAGAINADANCGFANTTGVLLHPTQVVGDPGQLGSLTWDVADCTMGADDTEVFGTDCSGDQTFWSGHVTANSERTIRGLREVQSFVIIQAQSIAPQDPNSIDLSLENVRLDNFASFAIGAGETEPLGILTITEGTLDAQVKPVTGYSEDQQRFTVPTPVALMTDVHLRNAHAILQAQGMTFELDIPDTDLLAANGPAGGFENFIQGTVNIDGDEVSVSGNLDPGYDPQAFNASFACNVADSVGCAQAGAAVPLLSAASLLLLSLRRLRSRSRSR